MKCELCGRQYIALGVHLRHKHKVDLNDYREEFGILRTTPLVDEYLSDHLSACANHRLQDSEYKSEVTARCKENASRKKGKPAPEMTRAGKDALVHRNKENNAEYLRRNAKKVADILREKKTLIDVRRETGSGPVAAKKMAAIAGVIYSLDNAKDERDRRAAKARREKTESQIAKLMTCFYTTRSAAEMCRLSGISITTYKNWLRAGLIQRHPHGRGKKA